MRPDPLERTGHEPQADQNRGLHAACAASMEKEGALANSGRWMQWRYKAADPPGEAKPDGDIMYELLKKVRALYQKDGGALPDPILESQVDYEQWSLRYSHSSQRRSTVTFWRILRSIRLTKSLTRKGPSSQLRPIF